MAKAGTQKLARPVSKCSYCGATFKKLEHAQRHERTHTLDRPYECTAPGCGKTFARQDTLTRHFRLHTRDQEGSKKSRDSPPLLPSRRRTKSAIDVPLPPPKRREPRVRRATESYLPSPAPSDEPVQTPSAMEDGPSEAALPVIEMPRPLPKLPPLELFRPYATPESITSPLPFTADSAVAESFDFGEYSSTSEDSNSLVSIEDDAHSATQPEHVFFASYHHHTAMPFEPAMSAFVQPNALGMSLGEPYNDYHHHHQHHHKTGFYHGYSVFSASHASYLAP